MQTAVIPIYLECWCNFFDIFEKLVVKAFTGKWSKVMNSYMKKAAVLFITLVQICCCSVGFSKSIHFVS